jgi:hypothetical protein
MQELVDVVVSIAVLIFILIIVNEVIKNAPNKKNDRKSKPGQFAKGPHLKVNRSGIRLGSGWPL